LYKPEYAEYNDVFVLIAFAAALGYMSTFAGVGMTATRQFRIQTVLFGFITAITALASLVLIPAHGLRGAGFVLIISSAVQLVSSTIVVMVTLQTQERQEEEEARAKEKAAVAPERPTRVLHVLGAMNRGGVEAWLISVLRNVDHDRYQMDFMVHTTEPAAYDEEIHALGSKILPCMDPKRPLLYARNFAKIMEEHGPYDVVHSHVHHFSGWVLMQAARAGVPVRVAHSHNSARNSRLDRPSDFARRAYMSVTEWLVRRYATHGLAASLTAAEALFGSNWDKDPRFEVQHSTSDVAPFDVGPGDETTRKSLRAEFGLPEESFVIGHVGRFFPPKNHDFLIDVAVEVFKKAPDARLLLVGDGELRPAMEAKVARLGIADKVVFAGVRSDVPSIMLNVMDIFVFTSISEGLGIAMVEAQAAALPCVYTEAVPHEADLVPQLLQRLSITESPVLWADTILARRGVPRAVTHVEALAMVKKSTFNIESNLRDLEKIYQCCR
jgi:glycosyltransferase involved in cell wall biosynthesis